MDKKLLIKTIISCLIGAVVWAVILFIICQIKDRDFKDQYFSLYNIFETAVCMAGAGISYYTAQKKKQNKQ